jgi:hypothetical protein
MVLKNPEINTIADLKVMLAACTWPNGVRPTVFDIVDIQDEIVPDRSLILQMGILKGVERAGTGIANKALMLCQMRIYGLDAEEVRRIADDLWTLIFKTFDSSNPPVLWYVSNQFAAIEKIVPAQTYRPPLMRDPEKPEYWTTWLNLGIYTKS